LPRLDSLDELALEGTDFEGRAPEEPHAPEEQRDSRIVPISTMPPPPDFLGDTGFAGPSSTIPPPPSFAPQETVGAPSEPPPAPVARGPESRPIATLMLRRRLRSLRRRLRSLRRRLRPGTIRSRICCKNRIRRPAPWSDIRWAATTSRKSASTPAVSARVRRASGGAAPAREDMPVLAEQITIRHRDRKPRNKPARPARAA
jgi:hypothetical protein